MPRCEGQMKGMLLERCLLRLLRISGLCPDGRSTIKAQNF
uniref:C1orf116 protein n=1 Tax=Homo sapiens TaxID=9606 RepID=Q9BPY1_HUMAN